MTGPPNNLLKLAGAREVDGGLEVERARRSLAVR